MNLEWINSSGVDGPGLDEEKRYVVRAQAMRAAAAARRRNNAPNKQNDRTSKLSDLTCRPRSHDTASLPDVHRRVQQTSIRARDAWKAKAQVKPVSRYLASTSSSSSDDEAPSNDVATTTATNKPLQYGVGNVTTRPAPQSGHLAGRLSRPTPLPLPGIEGLFADAGVNVLDLDELTRVGAGQVAISLLTQKNTRLDELIVRRRQSYLFHVPARYGNSPCLDDALRCVALRARTVLSPNYAPSGGEMGLYSLYGRALRNLQQAVNHADDWTNPDILGAIEILSIYEVLETPARPNAWESHIAGAARLIKARGPSRYKSEYEKALLASMLSPIICEAIRLRKPCFLDDEEWRPVIQSLAIDGAPFYSFRGAGFVQLWRFGARLPGVYFHARRVMFFTETITTQDMDALEARCRRYKQDLLEWHQDALSHHTDPPSHADPHAEAAVRLELFGSGAVMLAAASRLLSAVCPELRFSEEAEAVRWARLMRQIVREVRDGHGMPAFYLEQIVVMADSILATSDQWLRGMEDPPRSRLIDRWRFETWYSAMPDDYGRAGISGSEPGVEFSVENYSILTNTLDEVGIESSLLMYIENRWCALQAWQITKDAPWQVHFSVPQVHVPEPKKVYEYLFLRRNSGASVVFVI